MHVRAGVAVDLGTVNTLVWLAGRGLVLEEPSAIAINTRTSGVVGIGTAADVLTDKGPQGIQVIHPLRDGVIADLEAAAAMLHGFLRRALPRSPLRARALVCVPGGATYIERRSVIAAVQARRPRFLAELVDEPVAAAAGAGLELNDGAGGFVVDVGGGTTEIAAVAGWRVVQAESLRLAGNAMDDAIARLTREELGLLISSRAARQLKMSLGLTGGEEGWAETVGIDAGSRSPRIERVGGDLVAAAIDPLVVRMGAAVRDMVAEIPPGLAEEVVRGKIRLSGGGALLSGFAARIESAAGIGAVVADDPLRCVVRGAGMMLDIDRASLLA
jgi:rod shape-determining protein MreB and related proteins